MLARAGVRASGVDGLAGAQLDLDADRVQGGYLLNLAVAVAVLPEKRVAVQVQVRDELPDEVRLTRRRRGIVEQVG